jgi:hypothetical protein
MKAASINFLFKVINHQISSLVKLNLKLSITIKLGRSKSLKRALIRKNQ